VDPDGRFAFMAIVAAAFVAAAVSATTSIAVQAATVGWSNINWGIKGVLGAAIVGGIAGAASFGIGGLVASGLPATASAASVTIATGITGGAAGGVAAYGASAALGRGSFTGQGVVKALFFGAVSGFVGSTANVVFGGGMAGGVAGTLAGGSTGAFLDYADTGYFDATSFGISVGIGLASAAAEADAPSKRAKAQAQGKPVAKQGASSPAPIVAALKGVGSVLVDTFAAVGHIAAEVWNLPNTVMGLAYGGAGHLVGLLAGSKPIVYMQQGQIQFANNPFVAAGLTLGRVGIYPTHPQIQPSTRQYPSGAALGIEEYQHTLQGAQLGIFFVPLHLALDGSFGLIGLAMGKSWDAGWHDSPLETGPHSSSPSPW
jgi:hypothetical protein